MNIPCRRGCQCISKARDPAHHDIQAICAVSLCVGARFASSFPEAYSPAHFSPVPLLAQPPHYQSYRQAVVIATVR